MINAFAFIALIGFAAWAESKIPYRTKSYRVIKPKHKKFFNVK